MILNYLTSKVKLTPEFRSDLNLSFDVSISRKTNIEPLFQTDELSQQQAMQKAEEIHQFRQYRTRILSIRDVDQEERLKVQDKVLEMYAGMRVSLTVYAWITADTYAMWNKLLRERQIPYDLTYVWNLMNRISWQTKQKCRHRHREQTDSCQRGGVLVPEADSNQQSVCCGCDNEQIHMEQRSSVEKKGRHSLAWTGFYYFSGPITSRMVLIYYARVHCRWLPFTDNKGEDVADYYKEKVVANARGKVVELVTLHPWEV